VRGQAGFEAIAQDLSSGCQYYLMPFAIARDLENRWMDLRAALVARQNANPVLK
jgi:hypothetical protein